MSLIDRVERDVLEALPGPGEEPIRRAEVRARCDRLAVGQDVVALTRLCDRGDVEQVIEKVGPLQEGAYRLTESGLEEVTDSG